MKQSAFTLIELLVVVSVISILAAIAIPQFQQALVKSKLAHAAGDLKSLEKACVMQVIDGQMNNNQFWGDTYNYGRFCEVFQQLTTPIPYLSSIEQAYDVFDGGIFENHPDNVNKFASENYTERAIIKHLCYQVVQITDINVKDMVSFNIPAFHASIGPDGLMNGERIAGKQIGALIFSSKNPPHTFFDRNLVYEPSNGLYSTGEFILTNQNPESAFTTLEELGG